MTKRCGVAICVALRALCDRTTRLGNCYIIAGSTTGRPSAARAGEMRRDDDWRPLSSYLQVPGSAAAAAEIGGQIERWHIKQQFGRYVIEFETNEETPTEYMSLLDGRRMIFS